MSHLSIERLAALADEQPTADEHVHLANCAKCAVDLNAHRSLLAMAGSERESMGLPLTRWETLSERLRTEGLIVESGKWAVGSGNPATHWAMPVAAALLLVAGGALLGRASTSEPILPGGLTGSGPTRTANGPAAGDSLPATFASIDEANRWKNYYSAGYQRAVAFLAQSDSAGRLGETPAVMRTRLSALDRVSKIVGEALSEAPSDPVINDLYLSSFGQREATLRQLNNVLPQNVRLNSF
ncbi:MAG: hypothetical protein WD825_00420 [Gemmatimonadaceae bacterium]